MVQPQRAVDHLDQARDVLQHAEVVGESKRARSKIGKRGDGERFRNDDQVAPGRRPDAACLHDGAEGCAEPRPWVLAVDACEQGIDVLAVGYSVSGRPSCGVSNRPCYAARALIGRCGTAMQRAPARCAVCRSSKNPRLKRSLITRRARRIPLKGMKSVIVAVTTLLITPLPGAEIMVNTCSP